MAIPRSAAVATAAATALAVTALFYSSVSTTATSALFTTGAPTSALRPTSHGLPKATQLSMSTFPRPFQSTAIQLWTSPNDRAMPSAPATAGPSSALGPGPAVAVGLLLSLAATVAWATTRIFGAPAPVPAGLSGRAASGGSYGAGAVALCSTTGEKQEAEPRPCAPLTVIWDIDGTLCDSFQLGFDATQTVLTQNGHSAITAAQYHQGTKYPTPVRLAWHAGCQFDSEEARTVGADLGAQFDELYIGLVSTATASFYPGIGDLVAELANVARQAALTNAAVAYARAVLKVNNVAEIFEVVHGADDVPAPKPKPDGLLLCAEELGITPSQAVYVGDSPSDGAAARAAGMQTVGVSWGSHPVDTLRGNFDVIVDSPAALRTVLMGALGRSTQGTTTGAVPSAWSPVAAPAPSGLLFLLDRDGVINHDVGAPGVLTEHQLELLPGVAQAVARLNAGGHAICVVTNQSCVRKGLVTEAGLQGIHDKMRRLLMREAGAYVDRVLCAPGTSDAAYAPKPAPDMVLAGLRGAGVPASRAVMIGDAERDMEAAAAAGVGLRILVTSSHHGHAAAAKRLEDGREGDVVSGLPAAVELALERLQVDKPVRVKV